MIRAREVSSRAVVDAHIALAEQWNPSINAIVAKRYAVARNESDLADARIASDPETLPPLHGVPCTIKEAISLEGMPNTSGHVDRKGVTSSTDATVVARVRAAGAIPIGVTNVSELCMWMESFNHVYGRTSNPYDFSRIAGGSSGGEGSIIGAGASPFGIGADIGGSIRMPAFFNGVFGHKATGGRIPNTGQYPQSEGQAGLFLCTGPLARRAEDLPLLVSVLQGPDGEDEHCRSMPLLPADEVDVSKLRVLTVESDGRIPVTKDLLSAQNDVAEHLARLGARVEVATFPALRRSVEIWSSMLQTGQMKSYSELLGDGTEVRPGREILKAMVGRSKYTVPSIGLAAIERLTARMTRQTEQMLELGRALRAEMTDALGTDGVMLFPPHPWPAPKHRVPLLIPFLFGYTAVLNVMEVPVTQVPLGLNRKGVPLGVQVVGAHERDHLTMAVALELERGFGGWVPPER